MTTRNFADEFTDDPGGRYYDDGEFSGQEFRERHLVDWVAEALRLGTKLYIDFDGVTGLPTSFLEEAFGGLVRKHPEWTYEELARTIILRAPNSPELWPYLRYADEAMRKAAAKRDKR